MKNIMKDVASTVFKPFRIVMARRRAARYLAFYNAAWEAYLRDDSCQAAHNVYKKAVRGLGEDSPEAEAAWDACEKANDIEFEKYLNTCDIYRKYEDQLVIIDPEYISPY